MRGYRQVVALCTAGALLATHMPAGAAQPFTSPPIHPTYQSQALLLPGLFFKPLFAQSSTPNPGTLLLRFQKISVVAAQAAQSPDFPPEFGTLAPPEVQLDLDKYLQGLMASLRQKYGGADAFTESVEAFSTAAKEALLVHPGGMDSPQIASLILREDPPFIAGVGLNIVTFDLLLKHRFPAAPEQPLLANAIVIKEGSTAKLFRDDPAGIRRLFEGNLLLRAMRDKQPTTFDGLPTDSGNADYFAFVRNLTSSLIDAEAYGYGKARLYLNSEGVSVSQMRKAYAFETNPIAKRLLGTLPERIDQSNPSYRETIFLNEIAINYPWVLEAVAELLGTTYDRNTLQMKLDEEQRKALQLFLTPSETTSTRVPRLTAGAALVTLTGVGLGWFIRRRIRIQKQSALPAQGAPERPAVAPHTVITSISPKSHYYPGMREIAVSMPEEFKRILKLIFVRGRPDDERLQLRFGANTPDEEDVLSGLGFRPAQSRQEAVHAIQSAMKNHLMKLAESDIEGATLLESQLIFRLKSPLRLSGEMYSFLSIQPIKGKASLQSVFGKFEGFDTASVARRMHAFQGLRTAVDQRSVDINVLGDIPVMFHIPDAAAREALMRAIGIEADALAQWSEWILTEQEYRTSQNGSSQSRKIPLIRRLERIVAKRLIPAPPAVSQLQRRSTVHVQFNLDLANRSLNPDTLLSKLQVEGFVRYKTDRMSEWSNHTTIADLPLEDIRVLGNTPHGHYVLGGTFEMPKEASEVEFAVRLLLDGQEKWVDQYEFGNPVVRRVPAEAKTADFSPANTEISWAGDVLYEPTIVRLWGNLYQRVRFSVNLSEKHFILEDLLDPQKVNLSVFATNSHFESVQGQHLTVIGQDQRRNYIVEGYLPLSTNADFPYIEINVQTQHGSKVRASLSPLQRAQLKFIHPRFAPRLFSAA